MIDVKEFAWRTLFFVQKRHVLPRRTDNRLMVAFLINPSIMARIFGQFRPEHAQPKRHSIFTFQDTPLKISVSQWKHPSPPRLRPLTVALLFLVLLFTSPAQAARVLVVGDTQYALVADMAADIQAALKSTSKEYATADVKGKLGAIVEREDARVVVALGMEALGEALRLPASISVVYGLVAAPPRSGRASLTGVYMSPPVGEYLAMLRRYLPALGRIAVLGSPGMARSLLGDDAGAVTLHTVSSPAELVSTANRITNAKALLLLPDANLLSAQAITNVLLHSFKNNIPLLGISEANVKQGALFALVFDHKAVSRQIGEKAQAILNGADAAEVPAGPPRRYNLFINSNTARKMAIEIPDEMARKAKRIY